MSNALMSDLQIERFLATTEHIVPDSEQIARIQHVRQGVAGLVTLIGEKVAYTPERTIALRKLEEARMYAILAIVEQNA